ncbi:hypothetical protein Rhom172_1518 [Rhodothermus marinus SG0.5JP17-172]|uniref:UbiA family prenyltransferase n=1 Tax=Rhodothermus marinus TaxID=29549 RepID=UPI000223D8DF|nr:UbiA family prenyltransferase [Rhodothermus marinus]AEN73438.1 hypothetical protein Rhom172_1518 [Rhodothermus marinus SG0.5JP17-172]
MPIPFWRRLFWSGLHIPLLAVALLAGNAALLQLSLSKPLVVLEAFGAWIVYLLDRSLAVGPEDYLNRPGRVSWWREHRTLQRGGLAFGALLAGWATLHLRPATLVAGAGLGLVGMLYVLPGVRLKQWGLLKPLLIAGAWSLGTTLLPVLEAGRTPGADLWLLTAYRLLWLLPNPLLADWPDRVGDLASGVRTPAVRWSYGTLRRVALGLLLGALSLGLVLVVRLNRPVAVVDLLGVLLAGMVIGAARRAVTDEHLVLLDLLVAWPAVTAWVLG